jgi:hypothetical protein
MNSELLNYQLLMSLHLPQAITTEPLLGTETVALNAAIHYVDADISFFLWRL